MLSNPLDKMEVLWLFEKESHYGPSLSIVNIGDASLNSIDKQVCAV